MDAKIAPQGVVIASEFTSMAACASAFRAVTRTEMRENGPPAVIVKTRFKLADKRGPLVNLSKHLGLFKERVEHTGKDDGPIEVKQYSDIEAARLIGRLLKKVDDAKPAQTDPPKEGGDEAAASTPEGGT